MMADNCKAHIVFTNERHLRSAVDHFVGVLMVVRTRDVGRRHPPKPEYCSVAEREVALPKWLRRGYLAAIICCKQIIRTNRARLIPLTQLTATVGLSADLKAAEDESSPWPPKMADHAFGFLCWSPTSQEVKKSGKE